MTEAIILADEKTERAVLGSCIQHVASFALLNGRLQGDHFYFLKHMYIWQAMQSLRRQDRAVDLMTLRAELERAGKLKEVGDTLYLAQLIAHVPRAENVESYAAVILDYYTRRQTCVKADELRGLAIEGSTPAVELVGLWDKAGNDIRLHIHRKRTTLHDLINEHMDATEAAVINNEPALGIQTGIIDYDNMTQGYADGSLNILAGRPSMGKTAVMLAIALNAAQTGGRVLIHSLEQKAESLLDRLASMISGVNLVKITSRRMNASEYKAYVSAMGELSKLNDKLIIDDTPNIQPAYMRSTAYQVMNEGGLDLVCCDYLQIMRGLPEHRGNRVQEVAYLARESKAIARELDTPVLMLAQLSRGVEQRQNKRPLLSDLKESGDIEQEADIVTFLYRDAYYNEATEFPDGLDLIIAKHRNGPTGSVSTYFENQCVRIKNAVVRSVNIGGGRD